MIDAQRHTENVPLAFTEHNVCLCLWGYGRAGNRFSLHRVVVTARYAAFLISWFLFFGAYLAYWPLWLKSRGFSPESIGTVLGITVLAQGVASPLWGWLADRRGSARVFIVSLVWVGLLFFATADAISRSYWFYVGCIVLGAFFLPVMSLVEHEIYEHVGRVSGRFSRVRLWGSLAFLVSVTATGAYLDVQSESLIRWLVVAFCFLVIIAGLSLPTRSSEPTPKRAMSKGLGASVLLLILVAGLAQGSHAMLYGFSALHWKAHGISEAWIGILWAWGVVAETVFFWNYTRWAGRVSARSLIQVGMLAGVVRWVAMAAPPNVALLLGLQTLHALSFGAVHLGTYRWASEYAPSHVQARLRTAYASANAIFMASLSTLSGLLYANFGGIGFWGMAALSGVAWGLSHRLPKGTPSD